ncbi:hypothetical protein [Burkholderia sp. Ac-20379]|uniref:hypothetical protein n=1 Tax=Burkholderia sp. Ac-20379 TaxID=2703900 RepID=UPI001F11A30F|nr:hypothetical protein [Burkholderia sp. Ac-20379]
MTPPLSFSQRLAVWWSCFWRVTLATVPITIGVIVIVVVFYVLTGRSGGLLSKLGPNGAFGLGLLLVIASVALIVVLSLPVFGYMTRRGFARHGLTVPERYGFWQAVMLGLTTLGWSMLVSVVANLLTYPVRHAALASHGGMLLLQLALFVVGIVAAMYVVMPRQARRLRIQTGDPAVLAEMM